ncbi:endonuclease domain-containing protein [Flavobacterium sp. RHBU_3]|uniref:endonuclease domain-containing protein n=1 Tax=Flavobacterium sp. RHBU_3 TaxID=3391184 RepID=UPI0039849FE9
MDNQIIATINNIPIYAKYFPYLPVNPDLKDWSKKLRKTGNYPEVVFWKQVNRKKFHNIDFDRQRIIGNYIVDFYIKSLGLIVEIDGTSHNDKEAYDSRRDNFLQSLGLKVYRISYLRVLHDLDNVIVELENFIIKNYGEFPTPPCGHPSEGGEL